MVPPYRVMTVSTGNICRSPMAEVVLRARFAAAGLVGVVVDSTGISDEEQGNPVDRRAARVLRAAGYDVHDGHRARQVSPAQLDERDLVLAMTARHARALRAWRPGAPVVMYRSFDPATDPDGPEGALDVEDPWYGDHDAFVHTLAEIEAAADGVVAHVAAALAARTGRAP